MRKIQMTAEEAEIRAVELAKQINREVRPIVLEIAEGDLCVGFVQEPFRDAKVKAVGLVMADRANPVAWAMPLYESGLLVEHSDPRMDPLTGDDDIVISAAMYVADWWKLYYSALKKK